MDQRTYVRKFNVVLGFNNALPTQSLNCISRLLCTYVTLLVLKMYFMYQLQRTGCLKIFLFFFAKLKTYLFIFYSIQKMQMERKMEIFFQKHNRQGLSLRK